MASPHKRENAHDKALEPLLEGRKSTPQEQSRISQLDAHIVNSDSEPDFLERPAYKYQALNLDKQQIRLLRLHPKTGQCSLEVFDWHNAPSYTAISYTWGDADSTFDISINGLPFKVRENLFSFLFTFHDQAPNDKWLWIDQICIDQSNTQERNHQVHIMSKIYSRCNGVVMWLGRDDETWIAAEKYYREDSVDALATLLRSVYFSRLWIIQEILLCPTDPLVLCDNIWLSWSTITGFVSAVDAMLERHVPSSVILLIGEAVQPKSGEERYLATCVHYFCSNQCQDPRDKVYGLLGLTNPLWNPDVDYNKRNDEVFWDTAKAIFNGPRDPRPLENVNGKLEQSTVSALMSLSRAMGIFKSKLGLKEFLTAVDNFTCPNVMARN